MYRLSLIISEIYNKYLPLAQKDGISLNLDFSDTTQEVSNPEQIKKYLDENLDSALKRSDKGEVAINVDNTAITITDTGTILSKAACALLSNKYIDVKSRVGFGTTVKIFFKPQETTAELPAAEQSPVQVEGAELSVAVTDTPSAPVVESTGKLALKKGKQQTRLGAKLRLQRKKKITNITAAAKKADKEVKRIAKKAKKAEKAAKAKQAKQTKQTQKAKRTSKPAPVVKTEVNKQAKPKATKKLSNRKATAKAKKTTRKFEIS